MKKRRKGKKQGKRQSENYRIKRKNENKKRQEEYGIFQGKIHAKILTLIRSAIND
jgi:hypothetical protein